MNSQARAKNEDRPERKERTGQSDDIYIYIYIYIYIMFIFSGRGGANVRIRLIPSGNGFFGEKMSSLLFHRFAHKCLERILGAFL